MTAPKIPRGHLELLLLAELSHGPVHGYALIAAVNERSEGRFELREGTVYPALHRLEEDGAVASRWAMVAGRRRRVYELTAGGVAALDARRAEWASFAAGVDRVLGRTT